MAKQATIKAVEVENMTEQVKEPDPIVTTPIPKVSQKVTYHVTCPALGPAAKPYVTECGSREEAAKAFREVCCGLSEDAELSITEA